MQKKKYYDEVRKGIVRLANDNRVPYEMEEVFLFEDEDWDKVKNENLTIQIIRHTNKHQQITNILR